MNQLGRITAFFNDLKANLGFKQTKLIAAKTRTAKVSRKAKISSVKTRTSKTTF